MVLLTDSWLLIIPSARTLEFENWTGRVTPHNDCSVLYDGTTLGFETIPVFTLWFIHTVFFSPSGCHLVASSWVPPLYL